MFFRTLKTRLYFWLLGSMTLIVATAAGAQFLISHSGDNRFVRRWVLPEVRLARDLAQNLLGSGLDTEELQRLLAPISGHDTLSIAVVGRDLKPVLLFHPLGVGAQAALPTPAEFQRVSAGDGLLIQDHGHRVAAGLPIWLPSGEKGVFFVTLRRGIWRGARGSLRLVVAIGVILVVGWLLSWPIARHLTRPLQEMAKTADALGEGDLSARIHIKKKRRHRGAPDEIGALAGRFNAMAENLQSLVAGHKQLLGDVSHELRTPLARLKVALELARSEAGAGAEGYLDRADRQADAIEGMIEELLMYSRLEAAPYELHRGQVAPRQIAEEVAVALRTEAGTRAVAIEVSVEGEPAPIQADARLLVRALGNAAQNAVTHAPGSSTVRIRFRAEPEKLVFSVTDSGCGVAEDMREKIFQPFFRAEAGRARATGGVGLGLAIARRCMEAHGGGATAEPGEGGEGLTINLWLPAEKSAPGEN